MSAILEKARIAGYLLNLVKSSSPRSPIGEAILSWALDGAWLNIGPKACNRTKFKSNDLSVPKVTPDTRSEQWDRVRTALHKASATKSRIQKSMLEANVTFLSRYFELLSVDCALLSLLIRIRRNENFAQLLHTILRMGCVDQIAMMAHMIATPRSKVEDRLKNHASLISTGLVVRNRYHFSPEMMFSASQPVIDACCGARLRDDSAIAVLVGPMVAPQAAWSDFDHISTDRDLATQIIDGARRQCARGINILFYGPVGSGKTELCKLIAQKLSMKCFLVAADDGHDREPTRHERLTGLRVSQRMLAGRRDALVLFDEAEDVLVPGHSFGPVDLSRQGLPLSKIFLNTLLESNCVPTLWTCNALDQIDSAFIRRMTLALCIRTPGASTRARIWSKVLQKEDLQLTGSEIDRLGTEFVVTPAVSFGVARAARMAGGDVKVINRIATANARAIRGGVHSHTSSSHSAVPNLSWFSASENLDPVCNDLARLAEGSSVPLLCYGPSGTGKSAFAEVLAGKLGRDLMLCRPSDILSPYVGGTERNLSGAFHAASETRALLVFDKAEYLLPDRTAGTLSSEMSRTAEFLEQLENSRTPVICILNFVDRLDPAAWRRFVLKIGFGFLEPCQIREACRALLGIDPPSDVMAIRNLAIGDIATVAKRLKLSTQQFNAERIAALVRHECESKDTNLPQIGFRVGTPLPISRS